MCHGSMVWGVVFPEPGGAGVAAGPSWSFF